jgi:tetratricopeptide (TPR) repeat protein
MQQRGLKRLAGAPTIAPMRSLAPWLALLAACAGAAEPIEPQPRVPMNQDWKPAIAADAFSHRYTGEVKTSAELFEASRALQAARRTDEALELFALVSRFAKNAQVAQEAWIAEAALWKSQGRWKEAFDALTNLRRRHPESAAAREAGRELFEIARDAILKGEARRWLLFGYTSSELGIELMNQALAEAPQTEHSVGYAMWFAEHLFQEERYREVEKVCRFITTEHAGQADAVARCYWLLGEIALTRFLGVQYDATPLRDAEKQFHRVVEEFPSAAVASQATERRRQIEEQLAAKQLMAGDFYRSRGWRNAAALYYAQIVQEYPKTSVAQQAQQRLRELSPLRVDKPAPAPGPSPEGAAPPDK